MMYSCTVFCQAQVQVSGQVPGQVQVWSSGRGQVQCVQQVQLKVLDLGYTLNLVCHHYFHLLPQFKLDLAFHLKKTYIYSPVPITITPALSQGTRELLQMGDHV